MREHKLIIFELPLLNILNIRLNCLLSSSFQSASEIFFYNAKSFLSGLELLLYPGGFLTNIVPPLEPNKLVKKKELLLNRI